MVSRHCGASEWKPHQDDSFGGAMDITIGPGPMGDLEGHVGVDVGGTGKRILMAQ